VPGPELEAQAEGREELELLREAQRPVGPAGPVALPALEAAHPVLAGSVALVVDHEQDVALHAPVGRRALVVRTVDVQVVVDVHRHPVLAVPEPARHSGGRGKKRSVRKKMTEKNCVSEPARHSGGRDKKTLR